MRAGLHLTTRRVCITHHRRVPLTARNPVFFLPRFALLGSIPYIFGAMPSKPFELLPAAAKAFVRDMKALFRAKDLLDQDEIASRQLHALLAFQRPKEKSLRLADVKQIFVQIRDQLAL